MDKPQNRSIRRRRKLVDNEEKVINFAVNEAHLHDQVSADSGYLVADHGERTADYSQEEIAANVDITSATKHFNLHLTDFGPYLLRYTKNGRHLLLGGKRGHVAAFDWITKKLHCEINVMEEVYDVCWLHIETMYAVAQMNWAYIYDKTGTEIHIIRKIHKPIKLQFLPYHFLLVALNQAGFLTWLDVSIGEMISHRRVPDLQRSMTQNPANAVICMGGANGVVTMWSPKVEKPLAKLLCHNSPINCIEVDPTGNYMVTTSTDTRMKIWDIRALRGPIQNYSFNGIVNHLAISQKRMIAMGMGNVIEIYRDMLTKTVGEKSLKPDAYLHHRATHHLRQIRFCPYDDVLGAGHAKGFTSLLVPGAGESQYDALEDNPWRTIKQRQQYEVKSLLEKLKPEMITLDPCILTKVEEPILEDREKLVREALGLTVPKVDVKRKKKHDSAAHFKVKKVVQEQAARKHKQKIDSLKKEVLGDYLKNLKQPESEESESGDDGSNMIVISQEEYCIKDKSIKTLNSDDNENLDVCDNNAEYSAKILTDDSKYEENDLNRTEDVIQRISYPPRKKVKRKNKHHNDDVFVQKSKNILQRFLE